MKTKRGFSGFGLRDAIARPMAWRGIFAILFGIFALSNAWGSTGALALVFGIYAALEALAALMAGLRLKNRSLVLLAVVDSLTGAFFLLRPELKLLTFSYVVGAWAMLTGVLEVLASGAFRRSRPTQRVQAAAGFTSIALGVGLGIYPELGARDLAGWLGATMVVFGCLCVLAASRVRFASRPAVSEVKWSDRGAA
jgi:uncharacterized membrane protein HdeD (DUF308 family)